MPGCFYSENSDYVVKYIDLKYSMVIYAHRNLSSGSVPEQVVRTYLSVKDIVEDESLLEQYPSPDRSERLK